MRPLLTVLSFVIAISSVIFSTWIFLNQRHPPVLVSFTTEAKPLQDDEIVSLDPIIKKMWPNYTPTVIQCIFGSKPKCIATNDGKQQRPYRISGEILKELTDAIGGVWMTEDFAYVSSVACNMHERAQCQANGFVKRKLDEILSSVMIIEKTKG